MLVFHLSHSGGHLLHIASNQIVQIQPHLILQVFTDLWFMPLTNNQVIIAGVKVNEGSKMWYKGLATPRIQMKCKLYNTIMIFLQLIPVNVNDSIP